MSISAALNAALSGLNAASRSAEVVSSNVANALTDGYGRREITLQARGVGGSGQGVTVVGVTRRVEPLLIHDRRNAEAIAGERDLRASFLNRLERAIGTPESEGSLGARIGRLEATLIEAASRPESEARLASVADAARNLVSNLVGASDEVQAARSEADRKIGTEVDRLNASLAKVAALNATIRTYAGTNRDASALFDQRQQVIDAIASIVPLREIDRGQGQIALYTAGGAILLEGKPAELGFSAAGVIVPQMTLQSGALSGLTLNGRPLALTGTGSSIGGGSLAALFGLRDDVAVQAQTRLDAVARDLVQRFADPVVDPTLAPGDAGLFTDAGQPFLVANESGLAARIGLSAAVDPQQGGQLWRLRDGINAAGPGSAGQSRLLTALGAALDAPRPTASGGFNAGNRGFATLASEFLSATSAERVTADGEVSFAQARYTALRELELQGGVDTDQELQSLLAIEQSYAANAKVIQSVDEMIQTLLGL